MFVLFDKYIQYKKKKRFRIWLENYSVFQDRRIEYLEKKHILYD